MFGTSSIVNAAGNGATTNNPKIINNSFFLDTKNNPIKIKINSI